MRKINKEINGKIAEFVSASIVGNSIYAIFFDVDKIEIHKDLYECEEELTEENVFDKLLGLL